MEYLRPSSVFTRITKLFRSIASVSAGVALVFSVAGFLLLRSNANLLGLSNVLHHSIEDYVYEGGVFCIDTASWLIVAFLKPYCIISLFVVLVIYWLGKKVRIISKIGFIVECYLIRWRSVILFLSVMLFLLFVRQMLSLIEGLDLLFQGSDHQAILLRTSMEHLETLGDRYVVALLVVILSGLILMGLHKLRSFLQWSPVEHSLFYGLYFLFAFEIILLPINYGKNVFPNDFHKVESVKLAIEAKYTIPESNNLWLLNKTGSEVVLYWGDTQQVMVIKDEVLIVSIKDRKNIFMP